MFIKRKYAIFGAGRRAEQFIVKNFCKLHVDTVMDNNRKGDFYGYKIKEPYYDKQLFVIVTVDEINSYNVIRNQLMKMGYIEFVDFIPYTIYGKKMALAYGNCHMEAVKGYLEMSSEFNSEYGFYPLQSLYNMESAPADSIISYADLILHQSIRLNNVYGKCFASENILKKAKLDAKIIAIPNLYGLPKCFFPQLSKKEERRLSNPLSIGHEVNIEKWVDEGKTTNEIMQYMLDGSGHIYKHSDINDMWQDFLYKIEIRERQWDIKIKDYILENYRHKKIFSDTWHISTEFAKEIAKKTLKYLGFNSEIEGIIPCLDKYEVFIYEDVKQALDIQWKEKVIRKYTREISCVEKEEMNLKNYIEMCVNEIVFEKHLNTNNAIINKMCFANVLRD